MPFKVFCIICFMCVWIAIIVNVNMVACMTTIRNFIIFIIINHDFLNKNIGKQNQIVTFVDLPMN